MPKAVQETVAGIDDKDADALEAELAKGDVAAVIIWCNALNKEWAETVREPGTGWRHPALLLIGEGQPYRDTEVSKVLGMPVVTDLPDDPGAAAVYHRGARPPRQFEIGPYVRGLRAVAEAVQAHVARGRFALVEEAAR